MSKKLIELTKLLLTDTEEALKRFDQAKSSGEKGDFYQEVKPFADTVKKRADEWCEQAVAWLDDFPQRDLHIQQIHSTAENLEIISIQAFFPGTSRKRFLDYIQSIDYILKSLLEAVEKEK